MNLKTDEWLLEGLDGGNPLGFLAALGVMRTLNDTMGDGVMLGWDQGSDGWRPRLRLFDKKNGVNDQQSFSDMLTALLGVPCQQQDNQLMKTNINRLDEIYRGRKKRLLSREKELKKEAKDQGIKGDAATDFIIDQTYTLRKRVSCLRKLWLSLRSRNVPSRELGLGKTLSVTPEELRNLSSQIAKSINLNNRLVADLLVAFGAESATREGLIEYTPFCFVTGSGQQYFLDTIVKLMAVVTSGHIYKTLFQQWAYDDERLSLRLDPLDDRRYALMWDDPTAQGNESKTMWAANLLAYRALSLFPSFSMGTHLKTTGFDRSNRKFSWPLWTSPLHLSVIRSLLSLSAFAERPLNRSRLNAMGILEVYETERIQVGKPPLVKINFSRPTVV